MLRTHYIVGLGSIRARRAGGSKAAGLRFLRRHGFLVPATLVCTWQAYCRYLRSDAGLWEALRAELTAVLDPRQAYAIRSSADVEDGPTQSFAGQFRTILGVRGVDQALEAISQVWASAHSFPVRAYDPRLGGGPSRRMMGVLIQEMVQPVISGIVFSRNPVTGMDEVVVEAVRGSGDELAQNGVTPGRWINKWGAWIVTDERQDISLDPIQLVVDETRDIEKRYGRPVDLEWVYDGQSLYWVQLREITTLGDVDVYSNHISREFFPGVIKPLVWSVNVPLVNGAWIRLVTELVGPNDMHSERLARCFYGRAYFNMGALGTVFEALGFPRESLEVLMGLGVGGPDRPSLRPTLRSLRLIPRMLYCAVDKLRFGPRLKKALSTLEAQYRSFDLERVYRLSETELLRDIERIYSLTEEMAYYNIVTPLLMQAYHRLLQSQLDRAGGGVVGLDLTSQVEDLRAFSPNAQLGALHALYAALSDDLQACIAQASYAEFREIPGMAPLQAAVERFIQQFGHLSDSGNDFSHVPWRETPDLIVDLMVNYKPAGHQPLESATAEGLPMSPLRRMMLSPILARARQYRLYREAVSSLYTFGYGLFRVYFLALGQHLAQRHVLAAEEDVFYLSYDEIRHNVTEGAGAASCQHLVAQRRTEMEQYEGDVALPSIIYGDQPAPPSVGSERTMSGTPTSGGRYTGRATVVRGIEDFSRLEDGDVLVIPYSDVGWTPLFAKAGAVVAESGGILSHSSIIAREYGLPAVVSVANACRLRDGVVVTVDGYAGKVVVDESTWSGISNG